MGVKYSKQKSGLASGNAKSFIGDQARDDLDSNIKFSLSVDVSLLKRVLWWFLTLLDEKPNSRKSR